MFRNPKNQEDILNRIRLAIKERGLLYSDVAADFGTSTQYIAALLCGSRPLSAEKILEFSHYLKLPLDYLIYGSTNVIKVQPFIDDPKELSPILLMENPIEEVLTYAKNYSYLHISGITEHDMLVVDKSIANRIDDIEKINDSTVIIAAVNGSRPSLFRIKNTKTPIKIFYTDNGNPPITTDDYHIFGIVKRIVRDM